MSFWLNLLDDSEFMVLTLIVLFAFVKLLIDPFVFSVSSWVLLSACVEGKAMLPLFSVALRDVLEWVLAICWAGDFVLENKGSIVAWNGKISFSLFVPVLKYPFLNLAASYFLTRAYSYYSCSSWIYFLLFVFPSALLFPMRPSWKFFCFIWCFLVFD